MLPSAKMTKTMTLSGKTACELEAAKTKSTMSNEQFFCTPTTSKITKPLQSSDQPSSTNILKGDDQKIDCNPITLE